MPASIQFEFFFRLIWNAPFCVGMMCLFRTRSAGRLAARIDCFATLCAPATVFRVDPVKRRPFSNYRSFTTDWLASIKQAANPQFDPAAPVGPVAVSVRHFHLNTHTPRLEALSPFTDFDSFLD
jgi:hypothetical protein